nr:hypothetical protein [Variovorax sp. E3]
MSAAIHYGATSIILERFDPELALQAIEDHRASVSQWGPTMFHRLLRLPDDVRTRYDTSSMRSAVHARRLALSF